jgi:hypothetical protein
MRPEDFPELPMPSRKGKLSKAGSKTSLKQQAAAAAAPPPAASAGSSGGVSEGLKAANKVLVEKIRRQLDDGQFAQFKRQSGAFMQGSVPAGEYHRQVVQLGLSSLAPELASLCPDDDKRAQLVEAHR